MENYPPSNGSQWPHPASGSMVPQNFVHPYNMQFRPAAHSPQAQQFNPPQATQQYHPAGQHQNFMLHHGQNQPPQHHGQNQPPQFSQPMQQYLQRPTELGPIAPALHPQSSIPMTSGVPQPSFTYAPSFGMPQSSIAVSSHQMSTTFGPPTAAQPWLHLSQTTPVVAPLQQAFNSSATVPAINGSSTADTASDWHEFEAADGRRYYYNKTTKQSSWEKPAELMTPLEVNVMAIQGNITTALCPHFEGGFTFSRQATIAIYKYHRADASTVWKEFTTSEGRKYYYNKETKQSKWTIPDELKLAREETAPVGGHSVVVATVPTTPSGTTVEQPSVPVNLASSTTSVIAGVTSSPAPLTANGSDANDNAVMDSEPLVVPVLQTATTGALGVSPVGETLAPSPSEVSGTSGAPVVSSSANSMPMTSMEYPSLHVGGSPLGGAFVQNTEDEKKRIAAAGKLNVTPVEEKSTDDNPFIYATKQEAKNAFKALLESANVEADWNWDQAMRVIINDKRYGALKTLGERKQAFNEYLVQRKKVEAEERRLRQRKSKEEFMTMLEEAKEVTSSTRWSKAVILFEDDKRFKAVELEADREYLFRNYLVDLHKKEKAKAQEEHRRTRQEFRQFLESCAFIKLDSQWRKIQDQLEDDERCTRLDKIDRIDIFQDYIHDLEKEDEEQKKRQKVLKGSTSEQLRKTERKNRDAFRKMMEEHIANGTLTAKTHWRDYFQKVEDSEAYVAVASNISGSIPKDLFEDVVEELRKKYDEDKAHIKDALKQEKITVASTWTFEDFKSSINESIGFGSLSISDINLQLVYENLIDRAKEKEEKEAKKRKRLSKDFMDKLSTFKEINALSTWEECKKLVEDTSEYRSLGEESLCMEAFNEYVSRLLEKTKEKERKWEEEKAKKEKDREEKEKRKDREKREKERDKDWDREKEKGTDSLRKYEDIENMDDVEKYVHNEEKRREKDKDRKHRRRRQSSVDDVSSDRDDKEEPKKSRRHGSDRKKSRKAYSPESNGESKHKRHRRDHRDVSRQSGGKEELEDGELGEEGEIQ
ncbi:hypothetical protein CASFOL_021154 [Castilleja foliolosa]|uniref:Pre-mRNA-processing protein 40A n=1 Tax=Castilleja foliolosa TaxID=1961234 RepID=A0ABD3CVS6_9LAMI